MNFNKIKIDNVTIYVLAIFISGILISNFTPPFMAPDESNHIKRAYLFSKGEILLKTYKNSDSGGFVDKGLLNYINTYYLKFMANRDAKITTRETFEANKIKWEKIKDFSALGGGSFYFPLIYTPQAIGLLLGEQLNLSVSQSFKIARFLSLLVACTVLFFAFKILQPPTLTIALLVLPMTLFQLASSCIDGISTSLFVLLISIYLKTNFKMNWYQISLASLLTLVLTTSRPHTLPFLLFLFIPYFKSCNKKYFFVATLISICTLSWLALAAMTAVDSSANTGIKTTEIITFYISNPESYFHLLWSTITDINHLKLYAASFIGILGWFDITFSETIYFVLGSLLLLITYLSFPNRKKRRETYTILFLIVSTISILLIFFLLLINWNHHPAKNFIEGVTGRYFILPAILCSYCFIQHEKYIDERKKNLTSILLVAFFILSMYATVCSLKSKFF